MRLQTEKSRHKEYLGCWKEEVRKGASQSNLINSKRSLTILRKQASQIIMRKKEREQRVKSTTLTLRKPL